RISRSTIRPESGHTRSPTGTSSGPSSRTTGRCPRRGSNSAGSRANRRGGSATRFSGFRRRHEILGPMASVASPRASEGPELEAWEVFRQEKEGDAMRHGGSVMAPDAELAVHYARELYGRRQESVR